MGGEAVVVMVNEVLRYLAGSGLPHVVVAHQVLEHRRKPVGPVRHAHQVGMQRHAHHPSTGIVVGFTPQHVELGSRHGHEVVGVVVLGEHRHVVQLHRVRHRHEALTTAGRQRDGLIVVEPVSVVDQPRFGHEVRCERCVRHRRTEHAAQLLTGMAAQCLDALDVEGPLGGLVDRGDVAGVVDAVGHDFPPALDHGCADFGVVVEHSQIRRSGSDNAVAVEHLNHAPEADPVAVVAIPIPLHVGVR